jgi:hypothetical protein
LPAQPAWFHRLDEILSELRDLPVSHLDRVAVQKLFRVRERRARQIMASLPTLQVGNAAAVERQALIARLEHTASGDPFQLEIARRTRVSAELDLSRRQLAARSVRIATAASVRQQPAGMLGEGIELRPGELRIEFSGAEDLASKLFQLSRTMAEDWLAFAQRVEAPLARPPR